MAWAPILPGHHAHATFSQCSALGLGRGTQLPGLDVVIFQLQFSREIETLAIPAAHKGRASERTGVGVRGRHEAFADVVGRWQSSTHFVLAQVTHKLQRGWQRCPGGGLRGASMAQCPGTFLASDEVLNPPQVSSNQPGTGIGATACVPDSPHHVLPL